MVLTAWVKLNQLQLDGNLVCHPRLNSPLMCILLPLKFPDTGGKKRLLKWVRTLSEMTYEQLE